MNRGVRYELRFFAPGYPTQTYRYRFPTEELVPEVVVRMNPGGRVVGKALDGGGDPLPDAMITVIASDSATPRSPDLLATVNPDGTFRSALLPAGEYRIQISHPSGIQQTLTASIESGDTQVGEVRLPRR